MTIAAPPRRPALWLAASALLLIAPTSPCAAETLPRPGPDDRPPVPAPPCQDAHCASRCWIEPWLCRPHIGNPPSPPVPTKPCDVERGGCAPCMIEPWLCKPPQPGPEL